MTWEYDHIGLFLVTCSNRCFPAHSVKPPRDQSTVLAMREGLERRVCKACGERVSIEALWADRDGRLPAGAPVSAQSA